MMSTVAQTKCFNHAQREAVARCPSCKREYCRECVSEHGHRLLCASCLREEAGTATVSRKRMVFAGTLAQFAAGLLILWAFYYFLGSALLLVPTEFHATWLNP